MRRRLRRYLTEADSQLDIDGDGESKPLTDGLAADTLPLFGFSGDCAGLRRDRYWVRRGTTAEAVEAYHSERDCRFRRSCP